jgi:anti-sigma-K factor RskA
MIGVDERELDDLALEALAEAYATTPTPGLRQRVLGTARAEAEAERARRGRTRWRSIGALAATVALALAGLLARENGLRRRDMAQLDGLAQANAELTARLDTQEKTMVGLRESLDAQARALRVLGGPRTLSASLTPKEGYGGNGRVHVDAETGEGAVVLAGVEQLPPDKVYELWVLRGDNPPEPAGLLTGAGRAVYVTQLAKVDRPGDVKAFAVSIEPAGGSKSPTGPIVMVGALQG